MSKVIEMLLFIAIAAGAGAAGGYFAGSSAAGNGGDLPIAVIDVKAFIEQAITGPKGELQGDQVVVGIAQAQETAARFAEAGYIVLDRQSVLASPEHFLVKLPAGPASAAKEPGQ